MKEFSCVIADDEKLARDVLKNYIHRSNRCSLAAEFDNGHGLLHYLQSASVDVVLLDIEMPELDGLEVIRSLKQKPSIILTTAYRDHAVDAFELSVTDYLLKPFSYERFEHAIEKIVPVASTSQTDQKYIDINVDRKKVRVAVDTIVFLEAVGNYVKIHVDGRFFITYGTIQKIKNSLPEFQFVQIHRSFIVNTRKVTNFTAASVTMGETVVLPIGRNFKNSLPRKA